MTDFFEKITGSIDKGIKTISSKGKEIIEVTKLKGEIKDIKASIQDRFNLLGKNVFEMINRGALKEEEIKVDCEEIKSLFRKITELEEAIKRVETEALKMRYGADAVLCPKCGVANKSGDKFCSSCGSTLTPEISSEGKVCPSCGAPVKEDTKFCTKCGTKLA